MPRVTHVKSARKDIPQYGIKKGDSYYHWSFMVGGRGGPKICSKTPPKPSQLTNSEFLRGAYELQEELGEAGPFDEVADLEGFRDDLTTRIRQLGEEQQEKYDNMPDGLQQGDTGQLLETRAQAMESWADELDNIDMPDADDDSIEDFEEALEAVLDEMRNTEPSFE